MRQICLFQAHLCRRQRTRRGSPALSILRFVLLAAALLLFTGAANAQADDLVITHVTIIDPGAETPRQDMAIIVRAHDIIGVVPRSHLKTAPSVKVIDGTGKFVIPGLWDMHTHFRDAPRDLKMDVANGVLGSRDMGGAVKDVFPLRDAIARGKQLGPKIVACGPIIDGPNSWSNPAFTISVNTAGEARAAVVSLKKQGTDCIKVYDGLSRDSYYA